MLNTFAVTTARSREIGAAPMGLPQSALGTDAGQTPETFSAAVAQPEHVGGDSRQG